MKNEKASAWFKAASQLYENGEFGKALSILGDLDRDYPKNQSLMYAQVLCLKALHATMPMEKLCEELVQDFDDARAVALLKELNRNKSTKYQNEPYSGFPAELDRETLQRMNTVVLCLVAFLFFVVTPLLWFTYPERGVSFYGEYTSDTAPISLKPTILLPGEESIITVRTLSDRMLKSLTIRSTTSNWESTLILRPDGSGLPTTIRHGRDSSSSLPPRKRSYSLRFPPEVMRPGRNSFVAEVAVFAPNENYDSGGTFSWSARQYSIPFTLRFADTVLAKNLWFYVVCCVAGGTCIAIGFVVLSLPRRDLHYGQWQGSGAG